MILIRKIFYSILLKIQGAKLLSSNNFKDNIKINKTIGTIDLKSGVHYCRKILEIESDKLITKAEKGYNLKSMKERKLKIILESSIDIRISIMKDLEKNNYLFYIK